MVYHDDVQDSYFYGLEWPKPITLALLTFLVNQKSLGNWTWNATNGAVLRMAREHLNTTFNTSYTEGQVTGWVKALRNHFNLFDHMISCSGVGGILKIMCLLLHLTSGKNGKRYIHVPGISINF
ncbi:hypothetical protein ACS0TY_026598 [Phlomoides rotata]